jgi:hypothetical protein
VREEGRRRIDVTTIVNESEIQFNSIELCGVFVVVTLTKTLLIVSLKKQQQRLQ